MMANLLFDMDIKQSWIFPYIGVGVGYAWTALDNFHPAGSPGTGFSGTGGGFAYQAMVGASG
jgi:hypothetical protein